MINSANTHVLLVESDGTLRNDTLDFLQGEGFQVCTADNGKQAWEALSETPFDCLVVNTDVNTDLKGSSIDSFTLIKDACSIYPRIVAIAIGPDGAVGSAVNAIRSGARDYLAIPFEPARLCAAIRDGLCQLRNTLRNPSQQPDRAENRVPGDIIGKSSSMQRVFELVETIARGTSTVLITGETGTGKELVAQAIHSLSDRRSQKLVSINCGAIPESLLESELFGHVKGAFTGATQTRIGRFEQANGGTIFLDEIGNMSVSLQVKLLRVLQEREFEKVGGLERINVNVRVIAATSADLKEMMARGEFRRDLYYRLNVIPIQIPALRERRSDIPLLTAHFISKFCRDWGIAPKTISQEAMKMLMNHNWPGNVRELENAVERMIAMTGTRDTLVASDLPEEARRAGSNLFVSEIYIPDEGINFNTEVSELERKLILESLRKTGGNRREAAELLQLKRTTLIEKLRRFSIPAEMEAAGAQ